ncbi:MAG TPA: hypothetical protein VFV98_11435 [Vicinamibacterales bacterium]|nr:hypothetical protein [Vicinamibacterales bacterium]
MKNVYLTRARLGLVGITLGALTVAVACSTKVGQRQTQVMQRSGKVSVSAAELRARVNDLADQFMSRLEESADRIAADSPDRAVDRQALAFKIDAVPAVYTAAYRADPLTSVMDVWALAFQLRRYVDAGPGGKFFGAQQPLAKEMARDLLASADAVAQSVAIRPEDYQRARTKLEDWTNSHVIEHSISSRPSYAAGAASMRADERDAFVAIGEATDTVENMSERLNTYAAQLPKLARWQAELLILNLGGEHDLESALGDIHEIGGVARRANDMLGDVPALVNQAVAPIRDLTATERQTVLDAVNTQRLQTLDYVTAAQRQTLEFVTSERLATIAALREERIATIAAMQAERVTIAAALEVARVETLKEVDAIRIRTVEASVVGLKDTLDYFLWRVAPVLAVLMLLATVFVVVGYRLTIGRTGRAA